MNVLILKEEFHMDALKIMTEGMVKEEQPVLNIGDTVRVDVRIKEGREVPEFPRPSPFAVFPTVSVSKEFSRSTPRT